MKLSKTDLKKLNSITDKRPSTVIQHIIRHGFITTEELANDYGYEHAPRAARDVRERGVNLVTYRVKSSDGRNIAAYKFGNPVFLDNKVSKVAGGTCPSATQTMRKRFFNLTDKDHIDIFVYLCSAWSMWHSRRGNSLPAQITNQLSIKVNEKDFYCSSCFLPAA